MRHTNAAIVRANGVNTQATRPALTILTTASDALDELESCSRKTGYSMFTEAVNVCLVMRTMFKANAVDLCGEVLSQLSRYRIVVIIDGKSALRHTFKMTAQTAEELTSLF